MDYRRVNQQETWHVLAIDETINRLASDPAQGLSSNEASRRLGEYGHNRLPEGAKRGPWLRFFQQFDNILVYVLLAAGFVKLMLGLWLDASIITGVVVINAILGFLQEGKAEKALDSIRNMLSADARALRDGAARIVPAEDLVPGDIVLLELGDRIPADLRLIDVKNLRTDEAALTGESVPADKSTTPVSQNSTVGDRENMAFSGTLVVSGRATGVVVETGANTELGRINQMLAAVDALETPLLRQIEDFGHTIAKLIGFVSVAVFAYGRWVRNLPFVEAFQAVVGIAVSVIPEGLPALITITLAIGVQRMAQRNAIIRRLPAVETLGSVSRICSDKTGTLTLMEMMVASAVTSRSTYRVTGDGYASEGEIQLDERPAPANAVLTQMGVVSALCNDSELRSVDGVWKVEGDPTEAALYPFAAKIGLDRHAEREGRRRIDAIPFESEHKFMATLHEEPGGGRLFLVKGAPEIILANCDRQETESGPEPLRREDWAAASDRLAAQGERVLALAWQKDPRFETTSLSPGDLPRILVLLGLVGLMDPPRKEAIEAVAECHKGGIRVTMITGDHKITAAAIAKMLGIGDGKTAVTGVEIEAMNDGALQETVQDVDVFARASPEHKLRLVKAIQANGQVVAMTGDGVNDAPALKRADIGVAMGVKGTEVTKEAAAMVLADDNFASITAAVREGRTVYNNIEKALLFMLPTNVAQALVILVAIVVGFVLPITAPQILWVNMVTSVALGLCDLLRAARTRRDVASTSRGVAAHSRRLCDMACRFYRRGASGSHPDGLFLDEVARCVGRARTHGRRQHARHRANLLPAQQPLQDGIVSLDHRAPRQSISADGRRRRHRATIALYLRRSASTVVRHGGAAAGDLAMAADRRLGFLPRRRDREIFYSKNIRPERDVASLAAFPKDPTISRSTAALRAHRVAGPASMAGASRRVRRCRPYRRRAADVLASRRYPIRHRRRLATADRRDRVDAGRGHREGFGQRRGDPLRKKHRRRR